MRLACGGFSVVWGSLFALLNAIVYSVIVISLVTFRFGYRRYYYGCLVIECIVILV